ncbi:MAG: hypothetical protein ACW99G_14710 [Candidatus Thorarchaeota archaeon]|jgi:hypothetical protein
MADKYYVGDTPLIKLDCVSDIAGASGYKIFYLKPDKTTNGYVTASNLGNRYVTYQVPDTSWFDQPGDWVFQSYLLQLGSWTGHGERAIVRIFEVGR